MTLSVRMIDKVKRLLRLLSLRVTAIAFLCWRAPTGAIPDTIGQLQELQDFRLTDNALTGTQSACCRCCRCRCCCWRTV
jgi:hypothetical protein